MVQRKEDEFHPWLLLVLRNGYVTWLLSYMLLPYAREEINCLFILEKRALLAPVADLELEVLLPQPLQCYSCKCISHCSSLGSNFIKVLLQASQSHRGSLPAEASFRSLRWSKWPVLAFPCFYLSTVCGRYLPFLD